MQEHPPLPQTGIKPFCSHCGHELGHEHSHRGSFWEEAVELGFHFDFRHIRSLPLLFKPGFLAKLYCGPERGRYSPPLKIYVFVSLLFIGLFWLNSRMGSELEVQLKTGASQMNQNEGQSYGLVPQGADTVLMLGGLGEWLGVNGMKLEFDAHQLQANLKRAILFAIFLIVPLLSWMLSLIYWRHPLGFWEHMAFVLYAQSALFVVLIYSALMEYFGWGRLVWSSGNLTMAFGIFFYASQKHFYAQNWKKTLGKFAILAVFYFVAFTILISLSMATGFMLSFHKV